MTESYDPSRAAALIIETAQAMEARGINSGMSGNVSTRVDGGMLITPSSVDYRRMEPADIVFVDTEGSWTASNDRRPSSEWRFHLDVLNARPETNAVVHAHPVSATALACHRRGINSFHYMVAVAGGQDIRCADYATFGSKELSTNVLVALTDRRACLLANHGLIAIGNTLDQALDLAVEVETLAAQYLAALALGEPKQLSPAQMDEVLVKMSAGAGYGSSSSPAAT